MKTDTDDKMYVVRYTTGVYFSVYGDSRETTNLADADKFTLHSALEKAKQLNCNCTVFEYIPPQLGNSVNPKQEILNELYTITSYTDPRVLAGVNRTIQLVNMYMK
jgi:hypothetical protein